MSVSHPEVPRRPISGMILRVILNTFCLSAVLAVLLFLPAGTVRWVEAWFFIVGYGVFLLLYGIRGALRDPAQLAERRKPGSGVKSWDTVILSIYTIFLIGLFPVCALDAVRFRWSVLPPAWKAAGWSGIALAGLLILRVMAANTFASRRARIQEDRGQTVVAAGPYRYIRHPMYLGIILLFLGIPPALGSVAGWIPAGAIAVLFVIRTALEDRMLIRELEGYRPYAERTRFRLLPGIW